MHVPTQTEIVTLASMLQQSHPELSQLQAVQWAIKQLTGQAVTPAATPKKVDVGRPNLPTKSEEVATPTIPCRIAKNWERRFRSVGLVEWRGKLTAKMVHNALNMLDRQLQNKHVGLTRREQLLKRRADLRRHSFYTSGPKARVISGGLPSLGKRR